MNLADSLEMWPLCESYHLEDTVAGKVVVGDKERRRYNPLEQRHHRVVSRFAKLRQGDEKRVLKFVNDWGLLGWPLPGEDLKPPINGDPLNWIWEQSECVRLTLRLYRHLQEDEYEELEWLLEPYLSKTITSQGEVILPATGLTGVLPRPKIPWAEPARMARQAIAGILNYGLDEIRQRVDAEPAVQVRRYSPSLIGAIYWHLANTVTDKKVAVCKSDSCAVVFTKRHKRQKYCEPSCSDAYRQRKAWKKKEKTKEEEEKTKQKEGD